MQIKWASYFGMWKTMTTNSDRLPFNFQLKESFFWITWSFWSKCYCVRNAVVNIYLDMSKYLTHLICFEMSCVVSIITEKDAVFVSSITSPLIFFRNYVDHFILYFRTKIFHLSLFLFKQLCKNRLTFCYIWITERKLPLSGLSKLCVL